MKLKSFLEYNNNILYREVGRDEGLDMFTKYDSVYFTKNEVELLEKLCDTKEYTKKHYSGSHINLSDGIKIFCNIYKFDDEWYLIISSKGYNICDGFKGVLQFIENR